MIWRYLVLPAVQNTPGCLVSRVVDGAKPASGRAAPSTSVVPRSMVIEQPRCDDLVAPTGDTQIWLLAWRPRPNSAASAPPATVLGVETTGFMPTSTNGAQLAYGINGVRVSKSS